MGAAPRVKICGISTPETMAAALESMADFVGLVFFPKSPRHVDVRGARALAAEARGRSAIVALVVDADDALLDDIAANVAPDVYQLHGRETPGRAAQVAARFGTRVWKAIGVETADDVARAASYDGKADMILFDAKPPKDASRPGGNGVMFDWRLLEAARRPYVLSGGLDAGNVAAAVRATGADVIDVSSGVESAPGIKDAAKIAAFIRAAKGTGTVR